MTANADAVATTTPTIQHEEIASIGNTPTESSSNMTKVVEAVAKHTKEAEQQLKDVQHKTNFQTTKSKKWLKQDTPLKGGIEIPQNMEILLKQGKTKDINAALFIKSTTFATPINSETQATAIASPTPTITTTLAPTSAAVVTTTMAEAFTQLKQENKLVNTQAQGRGGGGHIKYKDVDVVDFESTTSKLEINLGNEKQQHEIKTKIANTKEIKSLAAKNPKTMQTKTTDTATTTTATTLEATTTNKRMAKITLKIPPELTANLDKPNKELKGFMPAITTTNTTHTTTQAMTTNSTHIKTTTTTTTTRTTAATTIIENKPTEEDKHDVAATTSTTAAILKTFKTIEAKTTAPATTTTATTALVKEKDLASNYQDNENNRQITKTINKTSNILAKTTSATTNSSSNINSTTSTTTSTSGNNKSNKIVKTFDIATTTTTTTAAATISIVDQQQPHLLEILMPHYRQSLQKDVNVKCMQSTSNGK